MENFILVGHNDYAGTFGGAVLKLIAQGVMLGEHQPVILYISDTSASANDLSTMQESLFKTGYPLLREGDDKVEDETSTRKDNQVNSQQMSKNQRRKEKETRKRAEAFARLKVEEETSKNKDDEEREDEHPKGKEVTTIFFGGPSVLLDRRRAHRFHRQILQIAYKGGFQIVLRSYRVFNKWSDKLDGIYIKIWEKGDPRRSKSTRSTQATGLKSTHSSQSTGLESAHSTQSTGVIKVKLYHKNIDIVRFYAVAYKHVNHSEYKQYRGDKEFDDDEVEKDLCKFFPKFYVDMFACICKCIASAVPHLSGLLQIISSCYHREEFLIMEKEPVRVLVKGTFGGAVLKLIAQGVMLGEHQPVILYISDSSASANDLSTMQENLLKTGYPLLRDVIAKWEVIQTRKDVDFAIISQRCNLDQITAPNCKVLVISPSFSDVLTVRAAAPLIPMKNFTCLTRLEHNKALSSISKKVGIKVTDVKNVIIWGKSFSILNLDVNHAIVKTSDSEKSVAEIVNDDAWLDEDLVKAVLGGRSLRTFIEDTELQGCL
ncbi:hypothetical protein POM88_018320 [Heracleum sosnowskyi]|uniref:Malate dehydrogenase n=1 Tax=Heracleum sosnowskyi TaxID=360622 RepID=A0AAD8IQB4_9APIA|nr:hypothetical protein POM88_018320 [Heracleum sosnowskyi]